MRAAAACAGDADPPAIDLGQRLQKVQCADRVPGLQAHDRLQTKFSCGAEQPPAIRIFHFRSTILEAVSEVVTDLLRVGVANHVVVEDEAAKSSERGAARLQHTAGVAGKFFCSGFEFAFDLVLRRPEESPIAPVTMRAEDGGERTSCIFRAVNISGHEKAGEAFKVDLFDRVVTTIDRTVHDRVKRRALGKRPKTEADEKMFAKRGAAGLPFLLTAGRSERKIIVQSALGWLSKLGRSWLGWVLSETNRCKAQTKAEG